MTPWTAARQASLSFTNSWSLLKLMSIESMMPSTLILCHPLLLLPSIFSSIRAFSNELALRIRWSRYWSFSFSISPPNEYSELISFRIDWFDLPTRDHADSCYLCISIALNGAWHTVCVFSCFSRVRLFPTLWTVACQAPLSLGFSGQEY